MNKLNEKQIQEIKKLLEYDEERLYSFIGSYVLPPITYFGYSHFIRAGKNYLNEIIFKLKKSICEDFDWKTKRQDSKFNDTLILIAAISDAISIHCKTVPPFVIATLLVKQGLDKLCDIK